MPPPYVQIYDAVNNGTYWKQAAIAVTTAQRSTMAKPTPTAAELSWCRRDASEEGKRIVLFLIGTQPLLGKLDAPETIVDSDWDAAMAAFLPNLLKTVQ